MLSKVGYLDHADVILTSPEIGGLTTRVRS